jgi:hypothetical protein
MTVKRVDVVAFEGHRPLAIPAWGKAPGRDAIPIEG